MLNCLKKSMLKSLILLILIGVSGCEGSSPEKGISCLALKPVCMSDKDTLTQGTEDLILHNNIMIEYKCNLGCGDVE